MKKRESRWLCIVNLAGLSGPVKVYADDPDRGLGRVYWWDKSGDFGMEIGKTRVERKSYKAFLFKEKREADLFALGATKMGEIIKEVIG